MMQAPARAGAASPVTPLCRKLSTSKIGLGQLDLGSWSNPRFAAIAAILRLSLFPNSYSLSTARPQVTLHQLRWFSAKALND